MKNVLSILLSLCFILVSNKIKSQCTNPQTFNDPDCFGLQNAYNLMNIPCAWTITEGDPNVVDKTAHRGR